jgi:AAHS family 4-hydroxybenzoate transporter-like MFS transporter
MFSARPLSIESIIDSSGFSRLQWIVLILCFWIIFLDGYDIAAIAYAAPMLVDEWQIEKSQLSIAMSAALFGLAAGSLFVGPLADRLGRKPTLILMVFVFGLFTLLTILSASLTTLTILRFVTGIGLGAAMPSAITLLSEYSPSRRRTVIVSAMLCAFPLGAAIGGVSAGILMPLYGWHALFWLGGISPLLLCIALFFLMPESVHYLALRKGQEKRVIAILSKISKKPESLKQLDLATAQVPKNKEMKGNISQLFQQHGIVTLLLWMSCFMSMLVFYMVVNWMPLLLKESGLSIEQFSIISALFPLGGGIGSILIGWVMDHREPNITLAGCYFLAGILAYGISVAVHQLGSIWILGTLIFFMGFLSGGGQSALASLSAAYYPTHCRATGVGSMYGIGRFGAIAGVFVGGELLRQHYMATTIFSTLIIPAGIVGMALVYKYLYTRRK